MWRRSVTALAGLDRLEPMAQPEAGVTYAEKIDKAEARADWTRPAEEVGQRIRGLSPCPGAWCMIGEQRVKLLAAHVSDHAQRGAAPGEVLAGGDELIVACGSGALALTRLQRAGKGPQAAGDFLRGFPVAPGARL